MSQNICPECGEPIANGERVCSNCQYELSEAEYAANSPSSTPTISKLSDQVSPSASTPETVMAHGNVDASTHHTEDKSTHNVDQSHTVNNTTNTFIIMGAGAPLPPNIDPQTAATLQQAQQQIQTRTEKPVAPPSAQVHDAASDKTEKGIGSINGTPQPLRPVAPAHNTSRWVIPGVIVVVAIVLASIYFLIRPTNNTTATEMAESTSVSVSAAPISTSSTSSPSDKPKSNTTQKSQKKTTPASNTPSQQEPVSATKESSSTQNTPSTTVSRPIQEHPFNNYKRSADAGDVSAMYQVAKCYQEGDGVSKNLNQAFRYMKQAAEGGCTDAYFDLGEMYHGGRGVTKDRDKAMFWYQKAAASGNRKAQRMVDNM